MLRSTKIAVIVLLGALAVSPHAAASGAEGVHAGPVAAYRGDDVVLDPCVALTRWFPRDPVESRPDWCATIDLGSGSPADLDLELPEATEWRLGDALCEAAPACPPESRIGTIAVRALGPLGPAIERGELHAGHGSRVIALLDLGPVGDAERRVVELDIQRTALGGELLRLPDLTRLLATDLGVVRLVPTTITLRLWGATDAGAGLSLGGCEVPHRTRVTWRPRDGVSAPVSLVDAFVRTRCGTRSQALPALGGAGAPTRPGAVVTYFATQRAVAPARARRLGTLRSVMLPELPPGSVVRTEITEPGGRRVVRRVTSTGESVTVLRWRAPRVLTSRTRLQLTVTFAERTLARVHVRFIVRAGALRAQLVPSRPATPDPSP